MSAAGLRRARLAWIAFAILLLVPTVASWPVYYALLHRICETCLVQPQTLVGLGALGLSVNQWAAWKLFWAVLITLAWAGVGLVIFIRRSDDYGALLMSALLVMTGPGFGGLRADLAVAGPAWSFLVKVTNFLSGPGLFGLICLFPNGRFAPRWTKWLLLYLVAVFSPNSFFPDSPLAFGNLPGWVTSVFVFGPFLGSFFALPVYRYWRVFNAAERQQTKWAVLGFIAAFAGVVTTLIVAGPYVNVETLSPEVVLRGAMIQEVGYSLAPLLIPVFIGVAVLRSRLWDIDVIIRRTLVYSVLTALLALAYTGSIVVLQGIVQALTGQGQQPFVTVISTLAIAALFVPLRRRVQSFIDRRFYRRKYDAVAAIAAFAATARDEVDLGQLTDQLNEVVRQSLEPAHTALWLKGDEVSLSPPRV